MIIVQKFSKVGICMSSDVNFQKLLVDFSSIQQLLFEELFSCDGDIVGILRVNFTSIFQIHRQLSALHAELVTTIFDLLTRYYERDEIGRP